jgi:uncharacterized HAD superfamily protein
MDRRLKIAFDLDDVLAQFVAAFIAFHNRMYSTHLVYEGVFSYTFSEVLGGSSDDVIAKVRDFRFSPEFKTIKPVESTQDVVQRLASTHELIIITSREETMKQQSLEWLQTYFPNCFTEVYFTSDFYSKQGQNFKKSDICRLHNVDIMIDDSFTFAEECSAYTRKTFLVNRPWNINYKNSENVIRIDTIAEVYAFVSMI